MKIAMGVVEIQWQGDYVAVRIQSQVKPTGVTEGMRSRQWIQLEAVGQARALREESKVGLRFEMAAVDDGRRDAGPQDLAEHMLVDIADLGFKQPRHNVG